MSTPLISVIIPNYCHAKYLDKRILSILNQTYRNFEIIILDDCSPDNGTSRSVIEKYSEDPHVSHIIYNEINSGNTFRQWNLGISLAKGDYCWIAESDDFCEVSFLQNIVDTINKFPNVVMAFAPVVYTNSNGEITGAYRKEGRTQFYNSKEFITKYLTLDNSIQNASCCIFNRKVALSIDKAYMKYKGIGDWWFWLGIAEKGNVVIVNKHLSYFRRHNTALTMKLIADGTNLTDEKQLLEHIKGLYYIPEWKWRYINRVHAETKKYQHFDSEDIYKRMSKLWDFEKKYSIKERIVFRLLNELDRKFLVRL